LAILAIAVALECAARVLHPIKEDFDYVSEWNTFVAENVSSESIAAKPL
jgi:hypothetical protein